MHALTRDEPRSITMTHLDVPPPHWLIQGRSLQAAMPSMNDQQSRDEQDSIIQSINAWLVEHIIPNTYPHIDKDHVYTHLSPWAKQYAIEGQQLLNGLLEHVRSGTQCSTYFSDSVALYAMDTHWNFGTQAPLDIGQQWFRSMWMIETKKKRNKALVLDLCAEHEWAWNEACIRMLTYYPHDIHQWAHSIWRMPHTPNTSLMHSMLGKLNGHSALNPKALSMLNTVHPEWLQQLKMANDTYTSLYDNQDLGFSHRVQSIKHAILKNATPFETTLPKLTF